MSLVDDVDASHSPQGGKPTHTFATLRSESLTEEMENRDRGGNGCDRATGFLGNLRLKAGLSFLGV